MSEPTAPPPGEPPPGPPPPPPSVAPPPPSASSGQPNTLMIVLSYLWILALVPLLVEKNDKEIQWHAKHGLVLLVGEIAFWIVLAILSNIPLLGVVGCVLFPVAWLATLVLHVVCIVKGVGGSRFLIPGVSQYADKF